MAGFRWVKSLSWLLLVWNMVLKLIWVMMDLAGFVNHGLVMSVGEEAGAPVEVVKFGLTKHSMV